MEHVEWAAVDGGRIIPIEGATCPADVMRSTHYHGSRGPIGVAKRIDSGEWEHLR